MARSSWSPERALVEEGYREFDLPFDEITLPHIEIQQLLTRPALAGYLNTWSATGRYRAAHPESDPVLPVIHRIAVLWGASDTTRPARWPLAFRAGYRRGRGVSPRFPGRSPVSRARINMPIDAVAFFEKITCNAFEDVAVALAADPTLARARDGALGSTPLHFAAHRGFTQIVEALLAAGADARAREEASDTTPLHWAAEGGHPAIARRLVEQGADLEALDAWYGLAPLGWATIVRWAPQYHEDKPTTAVALIQAGAAMDIFSALVGERDDVVRALVAADPGQVRRRLGFMGGGMEPLHFAVSQGQLEMARLLLDLGASQTARTVWGLTPLALAYRVDDAQLDELLRERGAVEDASTALIGQEPQALKRCLATTPPALRDALLFTAAQDGLTDGARLLLAAGAHANGRTLHLAGEQPAPVTPLHLAAGNGHVGVARALLAAGADPGAGSGERIPTPLHLAAGAGQLELAMLLLEAGAPPDAVERTYGATPREWARQSEQLDLIALFPPRAEE